MKHQSSFSYSLLAMYFVFFFFTIKNSHAQAPTSIDTSAITSKTYGYELVAKRTLKSKTFLNLDNNTITVEINGGYLHYRDEQGRLREIDSRIVPNNDSTAYEVNRGLYKARFGFDLTADGIRFALRDETFFNAQLTGLAYYDTTSGRLVMLESVQKAQGQPNGNKIRYTNAFNGVDVEYTYLDTRLKLDAFLSQKARDSLPDPQKLGLNRSRAYLVLVSQYDIPDSLEAFAKNSKISRKNPNGKTIVDFRGKAKVDFHNSRGQRKFHLPEDMAFVKASGKDSSGVGLANEKMWRSFYNTDDKNFLLSGVPYRWIQAQPRGTIVLDPTVSITEGPHDVWIENSSNFNAYAQIRIGKGTTYGIKRSLVKFDLSAIPSTAVIDSAKLELYFYLAWGPDVSRTIQAHQVLQAWKEDEATWTKRKAAENWNTPGLGFDGIDAKATPEDSQVWYNEENTWKKYDLKALTQKWVDGSAANYGVILWATNEAQYTDKDEKWSTPPNTATPANARSSPSATLSTRWSATATTPSAAPQRSAMPTASPKPTPTMLLAAG